MLLQPRGRVERGVTAALLLAGILAVRGSADIVVPTVTTVFFERGGRPVHQPVEFKVRCFGYSMTPGDWSTFDQPPGSYTPVEVFSFTARCPDYGCEIHEPFYLNYEHIDWCDLEGKVAGKPFQVKRYAKSPVDFDSCIGNIERRLCSLRIKIPG